MIQGIGWGYIMGYIPKDTWLELKTLFEHEISYSLPVDLKSAK
jgi:hypothetical protein